MRSVADIDADGKAVLVCTDFDVPVEAGRIADNFRIKNTLETVNLLTGKNAKVIIISFRGRPKGWDTSLSLKIAAEELAQFLNRKFVAVDGAGKLPEYSIPHLYFFGQNLEDFDLLRLLTQLRPGDIAVLENLRFYQGEEANDEKFARRLARFGEFYVNECFAGSHRAYASVASVPKFLPSFAGVQFLKEVAALTRARKYADHPVVVMIGGVKLEDKLPALVEIAKRADVILPGGMLANLLLSVQGFEIGKSPLLRGFSATAKELWRDNRHKIKLPLDLVVANDPESEPQSVRAQDVKPSQQILDIGPQTIRLFAEHLKKGQTLIWSGPLGHIEKKPFSHGTYALARVFAARTKRSAFGLAAGGQTLEVLSRSGLLPFVDHVSPGGGAALQMLASGTLPGIAALT